MTRRWWRELPAGRVTCVRDASLDAILVALDPLPEGAPPVIAYQPTHANLRHDQIALIRQELELAAIRLFPAWLPGAEEVAGPQGLGVAAVRTMASTAAKQHLRASTFLSDLAEAGLRHRHVVEGVPYAPAQRAAGAAWAIARSYDRPFAGLLIDIPEGLPPSAETKLTSAADWFAGQTGLAIWLTGAPLTAVDKYISVALRLEPIVEELTGRIASVGHGRVEPTTKAQPGQLVVSIPPVAGLPRADSPAERALESALAKREWAAGRCWNQQYEAGPLARPFRLDLWWKAERCVVEVDGPEHHRPLKYAADRRRDVQLQLDGHAVLRYTNDQVLGDLDRVISEIERLLRSRRRQSLEKVNP